MALETTLVVQGTTPTTLEATDSLAFSAGTFDSAILVDEYNAATHVRSSGGADDSSANTPNNVKYVASTTGDWGDGTESMANITDGECTMKVTVSYDSNITVTDFEIYAFDGTTPATAPVGMTVYMAESGENWSNVGGSAAALSIADSSTPATSHDFYISVSATPTSVGVKSDNEFYLSYTYQ